MRTGFRVVFLLWNIPGEALYANYLIINFCSFQIQAVKPHRIYIFPVLFIKLLKLLWGNSFLEFWKICELSCRKAKKKLCPNETLSVQFLPVLQELFLKWVNLH